MTFHVAVLHRFALLSVCPSCPVVCRVAQKERSKEKFFDLSRAFLSVALFCLSFGYRFVWPEKAGRCRYGGNADRIKTDTFSEK